MRKIVLLCTGLFLVTLSGCFLKKSKSDYDYTLRPVMYEEKWGYVDKEGKYVVNPQFMMAYLFKDGLGLVQAPGGLWGYIDKDGKYVIEPKYVYATTFDGGTAIVTEENGYPKLINKKGDVQKELGEIDMAQDFVDGLALFKKKNKYGYIDKKGEIVIEAQFDYAAPFSEDLAIVGMLDKEDSINYEYGYINKKGEIKINYQYQYCSDFHDGLAIFQEDEKYGYIDKEGKTVITPQFENAGVFNDGMAIVMQGELYGYIDKNGKFVINPQFDQANLFSEDMAGVKSGEKWGFIDKKGKYVINAQFDEVGSFHDKLCSFKQGEKFGFIDKKGKIVINPQFDRVYDFYGYGEYSFYAEYYTTYAYSDYVNVTPILDRLFEGSTASKINNLGPGSTLASMKGLLEDSLKEAYQFNTYGLEDYDYDNYSSTAYVSSNIFHFDREPYYYSYDYYSYDYSSTKEFAYDANVIAVEFAVTVNTMASRNNDSKSKLVADAIIGKVKSLYSAKEAGKKELDLYRTEWKYAYLLKNMKKFEEKNIVLLTTPLFRFYIGYDDSQVIYLAEIIHAPEEAPVEPYSSWYDDYDYDDYDYDDYDYDDYDYDYDEKERTPTQM